MLGTGIGGTSLLLDVEDTPVFVKRAPLTDLERRPQNVRSTVNLFDLPVWCQYGVGSPSFGVWRELSAHETTTGWVLSGRSPAFPLLYHWRALEDPPFAELPAELADVDGMVGYWHDSPAVRRRVEAVVAASASLTLFLEHLPAGLPDWLTSQVAAGDDRAAAAVAMAENGLRQEVAAMNAGGLFHFDAHLDNVLTDGHQLFLADFGLATSPCFELSAAEADFLAANRTHDVSHTVTRLVDWLVTHVGGVGDWTARDDLVRACAENRDAAEVLPPYAAAVVDRYAPVAAVVNDFYRKLHTEDRRTPYPADEVGRAWAACAIL